MLFSTKGLYVIICPENNGGTFMKHVSISKQRTLWVAVGMAILLFISILLLLPNKIIAKAETVSANNGNSYSWAQLNSCVDGSGYSNPKTLSVGDPLVGVNVAEIKLSNFSSTTVKDGERCFLKTVPDVPVLSIDLKTDLKNIGNTGSWLNFDGDSRVPSLSYVGEIGEGLLIIKYKDYKGKTTIYPVANVFKKLQNGGSFTPAFFGQEGSYQISLLFETSRVVSETRVWDFWPFKYHYQKNYGFNNYRIDAQFEIRNANAQVFAFDSKGNELLSGAVCQQFTLDFANSRYLQIIIKREIAVSNELMESSDVRFNSVGVDKRTYDTPGVWTITARNEITGESTIRRILVIDSNDTEEANALKVATSKKYSEFSSLNVKNNNEEVNTSNEKIVSENKDGIVVTIIVSATVVVIAVIINAVIIKKKNY